MRVAVLTSSRADFGVYLPLLQLMQKDKTIELRIIAFGTHCSKYHGETVNEIIDKGFQEVDIISTVLASDGQEDITTSYGLTIIKFARYWASNTYDIVLCLGDRYEMSAAVQAGIPFGVMFAHIHGGETTLGAIDNIYRHQITLASTLHFASTEIYAQKVKQLIGTNKGVYSVGALSLDGIESMEIPQEQEFRERYKLPKGDFILCTIHPETIQVDQNEFYAAEVKKAISQLASKYTFLFTMPNADTYGSIFRKAIYKMERLYPQKVITVENLGKQNYFAAMTYAKFLFGNTSSGIIEAASFKKFVVNVGERQAGRVQNENIIDVGFDHKQMVNAIEQTANKGEFTGINLYHRKGTANQILLQLKSYYASL